MKRFVYFEAQEGGMDYFHFSDASELKVLYAWMESPLCVKSDEKLVKWLETAEVGDMKDHRLGVAVRLKDKP